MCALHLTVLSRDTKLVMCTQQLAKDISHSVMAPKHGVHVVGAPRVQKMRA